MEVSANAYATTTLNEGAGLDVAGLINFKARQVTSDAEVIAALWDEVECDSVRAVALNA
jgi:hypothetical protein